MEQLQYLSKQIIFNSTPSTIKGKIKKIKLVTNKIANDHKKEIILLEYSFVSDEGLLSINQNSLNHDYFTDIITFDYGYLNFIEGDIYISIDRVKENAKELNNTILDELLRVIFHGMLHLVGYKDKSRKESNEMRKVENNYLDFYYTL